MKLGVLFSLLFFPLSSFSITSDQLGKEMKKRFYTKDEELHFTLINKKGKTKEPSKEVILKRLTDGESHYVTGKIVKPLNLKNTALTAHIKDNDPQVWVFLPSSKQVRRIQSTNSGSGQILGSELSVEDLQFQHSGSVPLEIKSTDTKSGKKVYVVEAKVSKTSKKYSKIRSWISQSDFTTLKTECYDKKNKLLKVLNFSDYRKVGTVIRPHKILVKNVQTGNQSELKISETKVNLGQTVADFNPQAMSR